MGHSGKKSPSFLSIVPCFQVANESKSDVQKVSAKVQVTVSFSAHGHHTRYTDTLQKELLLDSTPAKDGSEKIPAIARSNTLNPVRETPTSYAQFNLRVCTAYDYD
jgi:hypothetical protein